MNISAPFISRPVATTLLTVAVALVGIMAYLQLSVAPLPQVDFPTIRVMARLPGASPETMAATVATPLERTLGRIAGISEMTSQSFAGNTNITLQFDLDRDINGAARDVQAAINAARATLPTMPNNPSYRKMNPADAPIMIVGVTSDTLPIEAVYDITTTVLSQKLSQVYGVGQVQVSGSSLPAVRIDIEPGVINHAGLSLESLRTTIARANALLPKGSLDNGSTQWLIGANDQLRTADDFKKVIIRHKDGSALRLEDVATVSDSVQDIRNIGLANGKPAVLMIIFKQPGANVVDTIKRIKANLPQLRAWTPESVDFSVILDRSPTITASLKDVERTLVIAMCLVTLVVFLFLRNGRATAIPAIAVPISLLGTFAIMYLMDFSLNHLSLMALTIATGFVVDDAIVVTENIVRHMENGESPLKAAYQGSKEVAFTVISISISLVAIFIPILGMGGLLGRLFKEFAVTLSAAVLVSLVVSLVTTPMMCAVLLKPDQLHRPPLNKRLIASGPRSLIRLLWQLSDSCMRIWIDAMDWLHESYAKSLAVVLRHKRLTLLSFLATVALNFYLYSAIPKGFFPTQDTGVVLGMLQTDQSGSFQAMRPKIQSLMDTIQSHQAVSAIGGFAGGRQHNSGIMFITLKPRKERNMDVMQVISSLRRQVGSIPGADLRFQPLQDIGVGGRQSRAGHQYTLQSDDLNILRQWTQVITERFKTIDGLVDVNSDQESRGLQTLVEMNRDSLGRLGVTQKQADSALGLAFGQSFASTIYTDMNQYRVVMEFAPPYLNGPDSLEELYVPSGGVAAARQAVQGGTGLSGNAGTSLGNTAADSILVPLSVFSRYLPSLTPISVSHQSQMVANTISFNLRDGYSLSEAQAAIEEAMHELSVPNNVVGGFQGMAKAFRDSVSNQPLLILAAFVTLYIVLGILYESLIHPLTILSTLPSAGIGALLGLMLFQAEFTVIAFIGVLLLGGIVKKNAIIMIDFALEARRTKGLKAEEAIYQACLLRFRPIMMTTMAAVFGAIPLILSRGDGAEMRTPLGITIVGGLLVSQILTLYTTPILYLYLDRFAKPTKIKS